MSDDIGDFSELESNLEKLAERAERLEGEHDLPLEVLFTPEFLDAHSDFTDVEDFFDNSSWDPETTEELEEIPDEELDEYVYEHTSFNNLNSMLNEAGEQWALRQLQS